MIRLSDTIDVPLGDILSFAHVDLPDDFEGLFFKKKNTSWGLTCLEWEYMIPKDPRYYMPIPCAEKMSPVAGEMADKNLAYVLIYCHKGMCDIVGLYSANCVKFSWEGHNKTGHFVHGVEHGWNLSILTDMRHTMAHAQLGFINAGAKVLLNAFYQAGMRRVHTISDQTNYRSIAFNKWMGFSDPIHLSRLVPLEDEALAQKIQHYYFKAELKDIVKHIQERQTCRPQRKCFVSVQDNISGRFDQLIRLQHNKRQDEILTAIKKIRESICQK